MQIRLVKWSEPQSDAALGAAAAERPASTLHKRDVYRRRSRARAAPPDPGGGTTPCDPPRCCL